MNRLLPMSLVFCLTAIPVVYSQESMDLHQALEIATKNNPSLQVLERNKAVAEADIKIAQQYNNPSLIGETTRSQPSYFAGVGYIFELGGKRDKRTLVARSAAEVAQFDYRLGLLSLRHDVRVAYFTLLQARSKQEEVKVSRDLAQRLVDIAQQRYEAGDVARLEVLTAQVEYKQRENENQQADIDEKSALLQFNSLLNRSLQESLELKGSVEDFSPAPSLDSLVAQASAQHLELQSLQQKVKGEEANLALARAGRIPDLDTEAGTEIHDAEFQYGWRVALRFEFPLFNRRGGEILKSNATLLSLQSQQLAAQQKILTDVSAAYLKYQAALFQADNYRKEILPGSKELEELAEESYKEGRTGILGVIEAQRASRQIRMGYLDVLLQYQTAVADLEQASGVELP